jgi:DNA helicase-2/ATP-dependent DNA helicase PcrA
VQLNPEKKKERQSAMILTEQQKNAVEYIESPTLVVAGAGSGKTRTLTAKIAHLISLGFPSERILAITFTNKAAEEMKHRLVRQTGIPAERFPWVRTFHSACLRILKQHCRLLGFTPPLQIYAEYHQQKTLRDILVGRMNMDKKHVPEVRSQISNAKNSGNPAEYFDRNPRFLRTRMMDIYTLYEAELKSKNAVDFDNILMLTRNLLRDFEAVRREYREYFEYILCDEYQDTNNLQEELTRLLMRDGRLFCVGDDWQAIYSFRGSNVDHFLSFSGMYTGAKVFRLEQNFRSSDEIVQLANDLIGNNPDKMDKRCFSDKRGGLVEIHDFNDEREEASWITRKIGVLRNMGIPYEKTAILYRTKFCSMSFEQAFRAAGIPYRLLGGKGFFDRKEVLDLHCYLAAAAFPMDDAAFERIVNIPKRGIGPGAIQKLGGMRSSGMSLQDSTRKAISEKILAPKMYTALRGLIELLDAIREMNPGDAIREVLTRVGYIDYLKAYTDSGSMDFTSREENIEQLVYSASLKENIADYLEEAALIREDTEDEEEDRKGVNLSTIHAAKGLEFSAVFVVGCEESLFPHWKCMENEFGLQEERRLMYVAVTRSEKFLFLSSADFRKGQFNPRSRFLDEVAASLNL